MEALSLARLRQGGLQLRVVDDHVALSNYTARLIISQIRAKPDALICVPSGGTPEGTYERLVASHRRHPRLFRRVRFIKLDEWLGIAPDHSSTCETFLQERLLRPLGVDASRYISFQSDAVDPERECARIASLLKRQEPIDLCLLGLGLNGHLGLNEPGPDLAPWPHVAALSAATRRHAMLKTTNGSVRRGMTLGLANLLGARRVVLQVCGAHKRTSLRRLLRGKLSPRCPATLLWLHPGWLLICDRAALGTTASNDIWTEVEK